MILKLMKILKILRKILKNYTRSKNRHFKGFLKKWYMLHLIIISFTSIKNINFINEHLLLSCIIYYFTIVLG